MYSYIFLAVFYFMTLIFQSHEVPSTLKPVPTFDDGHTLVMTLTPESFEGKTSMQAILKPNATISVTLDAKSVQNASFLIFQVHSYISPLVLSLSPALIDGRHINGTDIGLYSKLNLKSDKYYIFNPHGKNVSLLLIPMLYGSEDPIPGGCNLSFSIDIAPFMTLIYQNDKEIFQVDAQPASVQGEPACKSSGLSYAVYELHLGDTSDESYFDGIISMVTPNNAESRGIQTRKSIHQPELRRRFASHPGFGSVYVVIVHNDQTGKSAAYVPIAKYGCIDGNSDDCNSYGDVVWVAAFCALGFITGEIINVAKNVNAHVRAAFIMSSVVIFAPALPAFLRLPLIGGLFFCFCVFHCADSGLDIFTNQLYPIVPAHIFFGLSILTGLGAYFDEWPFAVILFIIVVLVFYFFECRVMFPEHFDALCGVFALMAACSAATNGALWLVFVDAARILRKEFSDVIFSVGFLWTDYLLLCLWLILGGACQFAHIKIMRNRQQDYQEL